MDSDDDFEALPSSPVIGRKLKRLKKASRVSENPLPSSSPIKFSESEQNSGLEQSIEGSVPEIQSLGGENVTDTVEENDLGAKRVLEFESMDDELDARVPEKTIEESGDKNTVELEIKQPSVEEVSEKKENKNKKKSKKKSSDDDNGSEKKLKESISNKRKAEKVCMHFPVNYFYTTCH